MGCHKRQRRMHRPCCQTPQSIARAIYLSVLFQHDVGSGAVLRPAQCAAGPALVQPFLCKSRSEALRQRPLRSPLRPPSPGSERPFRRTDRPGEGRRPGIFPAPAKLALKAFRSGRRPGGSPQARPARSTKSAGRNISEAVSRSSHPLPTKEPACRTARIATSPSTGRSTRRTPLARSSNPVRDAQRTTARSMSSTPIRTPSGQPTGGLRGRTRKGRRAIARPAAAEIRPQPARRAARCEPQQIKMGPLGPFSFATPAGLTPADARPSSPGAPRH